MFAEDFGGRIVAFDETAARAFGRIAADRRNLGRPVSTLDAQIAALVLAHGAILATRDMRDFEDLGVPLVNPWED